MRDDIAEEIATPEIKQREMIAASPMTMSCAAPQ
jgi:hypothetical protein